MMIRLASSQRFISFLQAKQGHESQANHLRYTKPTAIMGDSPICYRDLLPSSSEGFYTSWSQPSHPSPYRCPTSVVTSLRFRLVQSQSEGLSAGEITGATTYGFCAGLSAWLWEQEKESFTLQGTNISHVGKGKSAPKVACRGFVNSLFCSWWCFLLSTIVNYQIWE